MTDYMTDALNWHGQQHAASDDACEECSRRGSRRSGLNLLDSPVDRRQFVATGALAAVSALLATACGGAASTTGTGNIGGNGNQLVVTVANFPALATVGGIARVDSGQGTPVAAVRASSTTFLAFSLICPHFGCTVGVASGSFACPCHGAKFASDGHWIGGQPTGNLTQLTSNYDSTSGTLTVTP